MILDQTSSLQVLGAPDRYSLRKQKRAKRKKMKYTTNEGTLTIKLNEHMGPDNSNGTEREILTILKNNPCDQLVLDAENLEYISSSGLLVLLRLFKDEARNLKIVNVSLRVYEIFEMSGLNRMIDIQKQMRSITVNGCPVVGWGFFGTVYRLDEDTVVKVYKDGENSIPVIRKEMTRARQAFVRGIPTAIPLDIVRVEDQYASVFEMLDAKNCNDLVVNNPDVLDELIPRCAEFLKHLHSLEMKPGELPSARDIYLEKMTEYASFLKKDVYERFRELLEEMPEDLHFLHGDAQLKNIMISSGGLKVIDMDKICVGNPVFEFASLYVDYVAYNEDDPEDSLIFMGIDKETALKIYRNTLRAYMGDLDDEVWEKIEKKIHAVACFRFLEILLIEQKDLQSSLKDLQIRHTAEHLEELANQVQELTI